MTHSHFDPAARKRVPSNFGAKNGSKRPFNQKQIWTIRLVRDSGDARASLFAWLELRGGDVEDFVFPSRVDHTRHLS